MAYNKAREERKWKARKEAEERQMRKLGVKEDVIEQLRVYDREDFNSDQRYYRRLAKTGTYAESLTDNGEQHDVLTVGGLLDSIGNEKLYRELCKVDRLTLEIVLHKVNGYSSREISNKCGLSIGAVNYRMWHFRKKLKKIL